MRKFIFFYRTKEISQIRHLASNQKKMWYHIKLSEVIQDGNVIVGGVVAVDGINKVVDSVVNVGNVNVGGVNVGVVQKSRT